MSPKWHQGRDRLDKKARKRKERAGPSPLPTPQASGMSVVWDSYKMPLQGCQGPWDWAASPP